MHRRSIFPILGLLILVVSLIAPSVASADGVIIVDPPPCEHECTEPFPVGDQLEIRSHRVDVTISMLPAVRHVVMNGFVQLLFYFSRSGRCGPRNVSFSRMLSRKKPDKLG